MKFIEFVELAEKANHVNVGGFAKDDELYNLELFIDAGDFVILYRGDDALLVFTSDCNVLSANGDVGHLRVDSGNMWSFCSRTDNVNLCMLHTDIFKAEIEISKMFLKGLIQ